MRFGRFPRVGRRAGIRDWCWVLPFLLHGNAEFNAAFSIVSECTPWALNEPPLREVNPLTPKGVHLYHN